MRYNTFNLCRIITTQAVNSLMTILGTIALAYPLKLYIFVPEVD